MAVPKPPTTAPVDDTSSVAPFCPAPISSPASDSGKWIDGSGAVSGVSGEFIASMAELYNDDHWQMHDEQTGKVTVIDGADGCRIAGDPNASLGVDNFCLECPLLEINGGMPQTVHIPAAQVPIQTSWGIHGRENIGVAINGVLPGPPAPLRLI